MYVVATAEPLNHIAVQLVLSQLGNDAGIEQNDGLTRRDHRTPLQRATGRNQQVSTPLGFEEQFIQ
jgi:hypothetical protein